MAVVTQIPATKNLFTTKPTSVKQKRRVAGYARVSTDKDEQFTSYEAQVEYYTDYIRRNPDWDFVKVYTDEGITGTSTKKRDGFNEMVNDALAGKIDLIVTKSVSRFARNTVDSLVTIRDLKAHGVEVFFEKENIYTFDGKGELLLTIMSSIAQEESRSISENVTWGHRKRFADGKIIMSYKTFLGYDKGEDGMPVINPKEAEIVRSIYRMFMKGKTPFAIAKALEKKKVPTPMGKPRWSDSTIISILTNEKYKGDALLQKTFTVDFLTKKKKANEGEVPQYYVKGSHPAIIDSREWEAVQSELAYRKSMGKAYSGTSIFSSRLVCGDCGEFFGSKVWHSTDVYRKEIWRCNRKFDRDHICNTPHLTAQQIQTMFLRAYNELMQDRSQVITEKPMSPKSDEKKGTASDEYRTSFWARMRSKTPLPGVLNALQIGDDSEGGYLVPDEFERTLIEALQEENMFRQIAKIIRTENGDRKIPVVASHGSASWIDEEGVYAESDDVFTQVTIGAHKLGTMIKVSEELLNDSVFDLESYITREFARRIGSKEEEAFFSGDGAGKPLGILADAGGAQLGATAASATAITGDELIDLFFALRSPYRKNAIWVMNDATVKNVRKLKDSTGQYLWQVGLRAGDPDLLLGKPVRTSACMPTPEAGAKTIAFGDFSYYWIGDRQGRSFKRLNELFAATGQVGFLASQRVDGKLILPEAVQVLKQKA